MRARHIILTFAAIAVLAAPATVLAQQGPGPGNGTGTCDGSGPGGGTGSGPGWNGGQGPHRGWRGAGEGPDGLDFFERMLPRMAEELGLTQEQLDEIQSIVDAARAKIEEERYFEQLWTEREAYRAANDDPRSFNESAFRAHAATQNQIQTELRVVLGQAKAEALNVLTAEQLEQLEELRGSFGRKSYRRGGGRRSTN